MEITTLRVKKEYNEDVDLAVKFYNIISVLNDFKWSLMECRIMAYTAMKGDISSGGRVKSFCNVFKTTAGSLSNSVSVLFKQRFLIKLDGKTKVNDGLYFNVNTDIIFQLKMLHVRKDS